MAAPTSVDDYLAGLPEQSRRALEGLRTAIRAAAPDATETISYQIPTFKDQGRSLVAYAAFKSHCSFFPMSLKAIDDHADELRAYISGRGTLRFRPDAPLPAALVQKLVRARLEENAARRGR